VGFLSTVWEKTRDLKKHSTYLIIGGASANKLYEMYKAIYSSPKPVIAKIQGSAFGGGVGLIAAPRKNNFA
jgi:enoyl-CoA hydratase/carnithine racemase